MIRFIVCFFIIVIVTSCTKEESNLFIQPYDTIFPEAYLPVYPGSYWNYNNGAVTYTATDYQLHSFMYQMGTDVFETRPSYVPYWKGFPVYRYSSPIGWKGIEGLPSDQLPNSTLMLNFVSIDVNEVWVDSSLSTRYSGSWTSYDSVSAVNVSATSGNFTFDSTIVIVHFLAISQPVKQGTYYYAKNVGLVRVDDDKDSTILFLDSYFINH